MKNFKLLLATATILSTGLAMTANAGGELGTAVHAKVAFIGTIDVEETDELNFGRIINPVVGQTLSVGADGSVTGSATSMSQTFYTNIKDNTIHPGGIKLTMHNGVNFHEGKIIVPDFELYNGVGEGRITCGTVSIDRNMIQLDEYVDTEDGGQATYYKYGGTLTITGIPASYQDNSDDGGPAECTGSGTATFIFDENYG